ncbi:hypothetical protein ACFE04_027494 [Oxalis oulophora]
MSITEFAMVQELAYLVKDNLSSKHLVLSMEQTFINFLLHNNHHVDNDTDDDDSSLELEPMSSYNRLLLHRLAEIFGFLHESVGDGEDRHLVLKRCQDTAMPSILVNDILWQYDNEPQSLVESNHLLRRQHSPPASNVKQPSSEITFEDRKAAYMAARERIFSNDTDHIRDPVQKIPRNIPVVARRMIAHALSQKIDRSNQNVTVRECQSAVNNEKLLQNLEISGDVKNVGCSPVRKVPHEQKGSAHVSTPPIGRNKNVVKKDLKEEQSGAAKRMFTRALGLNSTKSVSRCKEDEQQAKDQFSD